MSDEVARTSEVVLSPEARDAVLSMLKETVECAIARTKTGRSSMPIYVDDAMALITLAARAIGATDELIAIVQEVTNA